MGYMGWIWDGGRTMRCAWWDLPWVTSINRLGSSSSALNNFCPEFLPRVLLKNPCTQRCTIYNKFTLTECNVRSVLPSCPWPILQLARWDGMSCWWSVRIIGISRNEWKAVPSRIINRRTPGKKSLIRFRNKKTKRIACLPPRNPVHYSRNGRTMAEPKI